MGIWQIIFNIVAVAALGLCLMLMFSTIPETKENIETLKNVNLTDLTTQLNSQKDSVIDSIKDNIKVIETNLDNLTKTGLPELINNRVIPNLQNNIDNLSNIIKTKNIVIRNDVRDVWNIELIDDNLCIRNNISELPPLCLDRNNNLFTKSSNI